MKRWHILGIAALLVLLLGAVWFFRGPVNKTETARGRERDKTAETEAASAQAIKSAQEKEKFVRDWNASRTPKRTGTNAADVYSDAFALYDALTDEEKKMLSNPGEEVDSDKADALFKKLQPILDLLRKAAKAEYADWGVGSIAADGLFQYLHKSNQVKNKGTKFGEIALWSAGYRFASDPQGAIGDLTARMELERRLSDAVPDPDYKMDFQRSAISLIQQHMADVNPQTLAETTELLRALSGIEDVSHVMENSGPLLKDVLDYLAKSENGLKDGAGLGGDDKPQVKAMLEDPVRRDAEKEWIGQLMGEYGKNMQMPETQFKAWWQGVASTAPAHPLGKEFIKQMYETRRQLWQVQVEGSMVAAGLAISKNGPAQIGSFTDPTTGAAFTYQPTPEGGFELRSTFHVDDKPMTMIFPPQP